MDKPITITLAPHMFAVLSALAGLGVAVMQDEPTIAASFAAILSNPEVEPVAKELVELFQSVHTDQLAAMTRPTIEIVS